MKDKTAPIGEKSPMQSPRGAVGKRVYAIGDVHGCLDLLQDILFKIQTHSNISPDRDTHIILLGDLIDRGPQSCQVVEYFLNTPPTFGTFHFIKGNHEEVLIRIFGGDGTPLNMWLAHGGWQTIKSYGGTPRDFRDLSATDSINLLRELIPSAHIDFFRSFEDGIEFGDYFFTHAGIRPGVALADQTGRDLRWIREGFLDNDSDFGSVIVHGHTISDDVTIKANRVGVDTGAYASGTLSAFWIDESETGVLDTQGETALA